MRNIYGNNRQILLKLCSYSNTNGTFQCAQLLHDIYIYIYIYIYISIYRSMYISIYKYIYYTVSIYIYCIHVHMQKCHRLLHLQVWYRYDIKLLSPTDYSELTVSDWNSLLGCHDCTSLMSQNDTGTFGWEQTVAVCKNRL